MKQLKTYFRLLRKLEQAQLGKLDHKLRQIMDKNSKLDMNSGLYFDHPKFLLIPYEQYAIQ